MKRRFCFAAILLAACLGGCCSSDANLAEEIAGKTYYYDKEGFGGAFRIELKTDGTFEYYEGMLSSYIGTGKWTVSNDMLMLEDAYTPKMDESSPNLVNYFRISGSTLTFTENGSSNFIYVKVRDGETFNAG